jgi:hypothetical protein
MDLHITITKDQTARLDALQNPLPGLLPRLAKAFHAGALESVGRAVRGRFTGKGPFPVDQNKLGVKTGYLRRSIRATAPQLNTDTGTISVAAGSNLKYFAPHEFGFRGQVKVRGHTRKAVATGTNSRGRLTRSSINNLKVSKIVKGQKNYAYVKPHGRRVNIRARRPLGTELDSIQTRAAMRGKIKGALLKSLGA